MTSSDNLKLLLRHTDTVVPEDALARCRDLGMALGEGLRMGLF